MRKLNKLRTFNIKKNHQNGVKKLKGRKWKKKRPETFEESKKHLLDYLEKSKKIVSGIPSLNLNEIGERARIRSLTGRKSNCVTPLFIEDLHHLLLNCVLGSNVPFHVRWAELINAESVCKTVIIEIEGLSEQNASEMRSGLTQKCGIFPYVFEIISTNVPFATELSTLYLTSDFYSHAEEKYSACLDQTPVIEVKKSSFSRVHLLLSPIQLALENYPLPKSVSEQSKSEDYFWSKDTYDAVHDNSPMFAVDCEMCETISGKAVTRIAIVNENLETIYHTLVKPKEEIINYLTRFSGITEEMLKDVKTTLEDVHDNIRKILPKNAILCGHSLNFDLHALRMFHPYVIDTSVIFNERGIKGQKPSLKRLAQVYLKENIQMSKEGHNPIEDSMATMKLVQLKLTKFLEYGDSVLSPEDIEDDASATKVESDNRSSVNNMTPKLPEVSDLNVVSDRLFPMILRSAKKICLIGSKNSVNNYSPEVITDNVSQVIKSKIKKIIKAIANNIENNDIILSHIISDFETCLVIELKEKIKQIYDGFPSKTLFVVFMSNVEELPNKNFKHNYFMLSIKE